MFNQVVLVGTIKKMERLNNDKNEMIVSLYIKTNYAEEDFVGVDCLLCNKLANNVEQISKIGDIMGVKGFIDYRDGMVVAAEKITLLSSYQEKEEK